MTAARAVAIALSIFAHGAVAVAQAPSNPSGVTLQDVVNATLAGNSQIRAEALRVEGYRGTVLSAQAPFDLQLTTTVQGSQDKKLVTAADFAREHGTAYQLGVSKQLRSGITLSPSLQVATSRYAVPDALATGSASAGFDVTIPLMYDRGGAVSAAAVRVAELNLETLRGSWRSSVPSAANSAVGAYWSYLAAVRRVDAQREAEARAQRLLDETTQLVQKDERAPADLQQLRATVTSRRAARILAEQAVDETRVQLGILMGIDAERILALGAPSTDFPTPVRRPVGDSMSVQRLRDIALLQRPDLAMQRADSRATDLALMQARSAQQARLDVNISLGYQGFTQGPGYDHFLSPIYRNVPGLNATVQLRYGLSIANSAAHGAMLNEEALVQQQRLQLRDVARQIATEVYVAAQGADRSALALRDAEDAVALYRVSVENERRKLQLGMNTLFDVLNIEDALTNALLTAINNQRAYAIALASLRLVTGTLADMTDDVPSVDATRALSLP